MSALFEAEAMGSLLRAAGCATATNNALTDGLNALRATARTDNVRQLEKVLEFHRLTSSRLSGLLRALGEVSQ